MKPTRTLAAAAVLAACMPLTGCIIVGGGSDSSSEFNRVSVYQMEQIVDNNKFLEVGQNKAEALSLFPSDVQTLKASTTVDGHRVEEWRVYAQQRKPNVVFRRWIYFVDGYVAEFSDERIRYQDPDRVADWVSGMDYND